MFSWPVIERGYARGRLENANTENYRNWNELFGFDNVQFIDKDRYISPNVGVPNYTGLGSFTLPNFQIDNYFQIGDTLSIARGKHMLKTGLRWSHRREKLELNFIGSGGYSFNGDFSGHPFADFLSGFPTSRSSDSAIPEIGLAPFLARQTSFAVFVQDDWRASSRLTLNLGLRLEILAAPLRENNRLIFGSNESKEKILF